MLTIALLYWLLCARVKMRLMMVIHGSRGSFSMEMTSSVIHAQWNGMLTWTLTDKPPFLSIRFGEKSILPWGRLREKEKRRNRVKRSALRAFQIESVETFMRVGLGDAASTAVAAAALQAMLSAMAAVWCVPIYRSSIDRQSSGVCLAASACCIFSASLGDIMFAAVKAAAKECSIRRGKRDSVGKASH